MEENVTEGKLNNDKSMAELIKKRPKTEEELLSIQGFGEKKLREFGEELLKIINQ